MPHLISDLAPDDVYRSYCTFDRRNCEYQRHVLLIKSLFSAFKCLHGFLLLLLLFLFYNIFNWNAAVSFNDALASQVSEERIHRRIHDSAPQRLDSDLYLPAGSIDSSHHAPQYWKQKETNARLVTSL